MIDNLELIKPLLTFDKKDDFYMLYIFKRKKDQPEGEQNKHQSVRTIKHYLIENMAYLDEKWDEIVGLCEFFKARAYIHISANNHKDVSDEMNIQLAMRMKSKAIKQHNLFESVVGQIPTNEKKWIVDVDTKDIDHLTKVIYVIDKQCRPKKEDTKIIELIPTKSGFHLITQKFSTKDFEASGFTEHIQKKNPTLIYLPNSLDYGTETSTDINDNT